MLFPCRMTMGLSLSMAAGRGKPKTTGEQGRRNFFDGVNFWMKKRRLLSLLCAGALSCSLILPANAWEEIDLEEKNEPPRFSQLDDIVDLTTKDDGDSYHLLEPLYLGENGTTVLQIKTLYGYTLSARVSRGDVKAEVEYVDYEERPYHPYYGYYALTLTSTGELAPEQTEDFTIELRSGEESFTLVGELAYAQELPVYPGMRYSYHNGTLYRLTEEDEYAIYEDDYGQEEPASITLPDGMTIVLDGYYGDHLVDLRTDLSLIDSACEKLGSLGLSCWTFTEKPEFTKDVQVRVRAPEGARIYEVRSSGIYPISAQYEDGQLCFETDSLTAYALKDPAYD